MKRCPDRRALLWWFLAVGVSAALLAATATPAGAVRPDGASTPTKAKGKGKGSGKGSKGGAAGKGKEKGEGGGVLELPGGGGEGPAAAVEEEIAANGQVDPLGGLGLRNPVCDRVREIRNRETRLSCEATGTPEAYYPRGNYGFDKHIPTGMTHPVGSATDVFTSVLNGIWMFFGFALHGVLTLLGLAFSLNPFGDGRTMGDVTAALGRVYRRITDPWLTTLVVCGGIWFAYKALVKRDVAASAAGTVAAIAMVVVGLWVVHEPRQSVGRVAKIADRVALTVVSAPQSGSLNRPVGSYAEAMSRVAAQILEVPFAGLNFSDLRWAMSKPPPEAVEKADEKFCEDVGALAELARMADLGSEEAKEACADYARKRYGEPKRVIDLYLRSSPGSPARDALWEYFDKEEADRFKAKVAAQGGDGALTRLSMLLLFGIGLIGSIVLFAWLAVRLFTQSAVAFVLLLVAPFALFFPLLGESGRQAFKRWGLALLGAIASKVVYAGFLSVVMLGMSVLGRVEGPAGSATGFLLASVFAWAVLLKRNEILGWMSIGEPVTARARGGHGMGGILGAHAGMSAAGAVSGFVRRGARWRRGRAAERAEATRQTAGGSLRESARALASHRLSDAERTVAAFEGRGGRGGDDDGTGGSPAKGGGGRDGGDKGGGAAGIGRGLVAERKGSAEAGQGTERGSGAGAPVPERPSRERYEAAKALVARAKRNERRTGERWSPAELKKIEKEDRELLKKSRDPADHAHRVGMDRSQFEALRGAARDEAAERIERARQRDAKRAKLTDERPGRVVGRGRAPVEKMRQLREGPAVNAERRAHLKRLRRERIARARAERRNMSRGG